MKKKKVIIDTDPGVDDCTALTFMLNDPEFDIKLITTSNGNVDIANCTRNMCHLLDLFHITLPVVEGYRQRLGNNTEDASFLHTKEGLGGWKPPKNTKHKPVDVDAADSMYEVLCEFPKEITIIVLGPHTNVGYLLRKHPDARNLAKQIVMMGGAPTGVQADPNHNSFNIRTDTPAFKEVIDSKIPTVMIPSSIGRDRGYFSEQMVEQIKNTNDVGKFLAKTFGTYWEPNYPDRRISANDLAAVYYLKFPSLYKMKRANIELDIRTGKTTPKYTRNGMFNIALDLKREKFLKLVFKQLRTLDKIKIPELEKHTKDVKSPSWDTTKTTPKKKNSASKKKTLSQKNTSKTTKKAENTAKKGSKRPITSAKKAIRVAKRVTKAKNPAPKTIKQGSMLTRNSKKQ